MQTYEIYYAPVCSCDSEWQRLGDLQASSTDDAVKQAAQRWKDYPPGLLVALAETTLPITVPVARFL
jgi:hypothetical protein